MVMAECAKNSGLSNGPKSSFKCDRSHKIDESSLEKVREKWRKIKGDDERENDEFDFFCQLMQARERNERGEIFKRDPKAEKLYGHLFVVSNYLDKARILRAGMQREISTFYTSSPHSSSSYSPYSPTETLAEEVDEWDAKITELENELLAIDIAQRFHGNEIHSRRFLEWLVEEEEVMSCICQTYTQLRSFCGCKTLKRAKNFSDEWIEKLDFKSGFQTREEGEKQNQYLKDLEI